MWEEELAILVEAFLRQPCVSTRSCGSSLSAPFRAALLQPEQLQALHSYVPAPLLPQALLICSPESAPSCKEGVPAHPLCRQLAHALCEWMASSVFPRALECIPGLSEEDHLQGKVKDWAENITEQLTTLQQLVQRVKLHLQVKESFFSQLRERSPDTLYTVVDECYSTKGTEGSSRIKTHNSFVQGDLFLLNRMLLQEVQIGCSLDTSCMLSNATKTFASLVYYEGGTNGVLLDKNPCKEEMGKTAPAMWMHCMPEIKQPLKIMEKVLEVLGVEGIKALLGFRSTIGSITDALSPSRSLLLASFLEANEVDVAGSKLTVGGRALAKHVHRSTSGWWGPF